MFVISGLIALFKQCLHWHSIENLISVSTKSSESARAMITLTAVHISSHQPGWVQNEVAI